MDSLFEKKLTSFIASKPRFAFPENAGHAGTAGRCPSALSIGDAFCVACFWVSCGFLISCQGDFESQ